MIDWVKLVVLALGLVGDFTRWVERTQLKNDVERELLREMVEKHNAAVFEAEEIRARVRAELDVAPGKLRDHPDAHFRD